VFPFAFISRVITGVPNFHSRVLPFIFPHLFSFYLPAFLFSIALFVSRYFSFNQVSMAMQVVETC
jgi:hypothetical protein